MAGSVLGSDACGQSWEWYPGIWIQVPPPQDTAFAPLFLCKMLTIFPRSARNCEPQFLSFEPFRIAKIQRGNYSSRYTWTSSWKEASPGEASSGDLLVPEFSIVDWSPPSTQHPSPSCAHRRSAFNYTFRLSPPIIQSGCLVKQRIMGIGSLKLNRLLLKQESDFSETK